MGTTEVDADDLRKLLNAVAAGGWCSGAGTSDPNHKGPTLKDATALIEQHHRDNEAHWNAHDTSEGVEAAAYRTPEDLARMYHKARAITSTGGMRPTDWGDQPENMKAIDIQIARSLISALLRGGA